jgi:methylase of polypeptide subunit release factors
MQLSLQALAQACQRAPSDAERNEDVSVQSTAATAGDEALVALLQALKRRGYRFVTPTPATHARVVARASKAEATSITDVLGWSRPFQRRILDDEVFHLLDRGEALRQNPDGLFESTIRVSSLHDRLFIHSAYPTEAEDAVFLGPDSYRFADLIERELTARPLPSPGGIVDIGSGAGVGALVAAGLCPGSTVTMIDINPVALRFGEINARAAQVGAAFVCGDTLDAVDDPIRLAIANPPFIVDDAGRAYRHGGGMHGTEIALDMAKSAVRRLAPDGRLILYTGSAIIDGEDPLAEALAELAAGAGRTLRYFEIDPDVFGEELDGPAYADVDRIAVVAAIIA